MSKTTTTESPFLWDTLDTDGDDHVTGDAFIKGEEYDVVATVFSYRYNDGIDVNHVPHAVLIEKDGTIVHEAECHDTSNPWKAIERAKRAAKRLADDPDQHTQ